MSSRQKNSKVRLVIELVGPTLSVEATLNAVIHAAQSHSGILVSFPEPLRIVPHVRARTPKAKAGQEA